MIPSAAAGGAPAQQQRSHRNHKKSKETPANQVAPCKHNNWDNVRIKKGNHSLRCRTCQEQWRVHHSFFSRCVPFYKGKCELGARCPNVHIHQYKEGLKDRRERFGDKVLYGVPEKILGAHGIAEAEQTTTQPLLPLQDNINLNNTAPPNSINLTSVYEDDEEEFAATQPQSEIIAKMQQAAEVPPSLPSTAFQRHSSNLSVQSTQSIRSSTASSYRRLSSNLSQSSMRGPSPPHMFFGQNALPVTPVTIPTPDMSFSHMQCPSSPMTPTKLPGTPSCQTPGGSNRTPPVKYDDNEGVTPLTDSV